MREEERLGVRVALEKSGRVAPAVDAEVERLVRADRPGPQGLGPALAQVCLAPAEQLGARLLAARVRADGDGADDAVGLVEGGQVLVRPEPGVGKTGQAAGLVLGDKEPGRVEVRL